MIQNEDINLFEQIQRMIGNIDGDDMKEQPKLFYRIKQKIISFPSRTKFIDIYKVFNSIGILAYNQEGRSIRNLRLDIQIYFDEQKYISLISKYDENII